MNDRVFDVAIAGGGFAGSSLAGVLARGGLDVVVIERERHFRDRIRGEFTWPWGRAEIERLGLLPVFESIGALELRQMNEYLGGAYSRSIEIVPRPGLTYQHAALQDALLGWATVQGATVVRPGRVRRFDGGSTAALLVALEDSEIAIRARLVVAATGKDSSARNWTGGDSVTDPEHHRFGGVSIEGACFPAGTLMLGQHSPEQALLFHLSDSISRFYVRAFGDDVKGQRLDRSFDALLNHARPWFESDVLSNAKQVGPLGFFPNSTSWATRLTGTGVALIGDVAGSADPSGGHGTSLTFRDVRVLSDLLLGSKDWDTALEIYERERTAYYDVLRARDRWYGDVAAGRGPLGEERRANQAKARELDPMLGGFGAIEFLGPDGLVADEAHRRIFFGEAISPIDPVARS